MSDESEDNGGSEPIETGAGTSEDEGLIGIPIETEERGANPWRGRDADESAQYR